MRRCVLPTRPAACIVWAGRASNLKADWSDAQPQLPGFCSVREPHDDAAAATAAQSQQQCKFNLQKKQKMGWRY